MKTGKEGRVKTGERDGTGEEEMRWSWTDSLELWEWSGESRNTRADRIFRTRVPERRELN